VGRVACSLQQSEQNRRKCGLRAVPEMRLDSEDSVGEMCGLLYLKEGLSLVSQFITVIFIFADTLME